MKMNRNKSSTMKVLLGLVLAGCFLPLQTRAQVQDIHSFVSCLNGITTTNPTVADAVACVPDHCYYTTTLSEESAQPGCKLEDGTRLPRVIFSCRGPGGSQTLRFRPSFTLCTQPRNLINHIELGEDVNSYHVQKMADVDSPPDVSNFQVFTEFGTGATAVVDTRVPANNKGCFDCHDSKGTRTVGNVVVNLFAPVPPELAEGTIDTNDPSVAKPANPTLLSDICNGIAHSSQLARYPSRLALAVNLCHRLELKTH